ncbi:transcription factor TFIIIB component [Penicillium lagena]|uniref:transcription factor TFIIIB component n=1 Tax=Penicillium lagena TaxID=94218 RepID=UPI00254238DF|nr:transcription factor TFIIIB component [Penicillium lagena]KAJ5613056.1 transcription factor TFIIIB component [Penicillium lagena]
MKSFSSSAINKSGKKFAPKAPARRAAPASTASSRRPSATQHTAQGQVAQAAQHEKDVAATVPRPSVEAEPAAPAVAEETPTVESIAPQATTVASTSATAIPIPRPKRKASISKPAPPPTTAITPPPTQHVPLSPTPTTQPQSQPVPSIETDINDADMDLVRRAVQSSNNIPPASAGEGSASAPSEARAAKRAKRTSVSQQAVPLIESTSATPAESVPPSTPGSNRTAAKGKKRKTSKVGMPEADGDAEKAKRARRKKREPTPEGAEMVEILPNVIKMSELCKDLKTGKKSKRETELRKMDLTEQERKKRPQDGQESAEGTPIKQNGDADSATKDRLPDFKPQSGPVMRIVNGEIVLDTASLQVDRHADAVRSAGDLENVEESSLTRKINQSSYGKRSKTETWDEEMTDLFYRGLRMFGTDFMVISKLFPGRSRRQIKLKFNNEERRDPHRIKETLLGPRESIDIETYSEMTKTTYDDPKVIQQELDDEKKRIEEQHAQEKKMQEDLFHNPEGNKDSTAASGGDKANGTAVKGKSRKKSTIKTIGGGTEEVLGSIDDIPAPA